MGKRWACKATAERLLKEAGEKVKELKARDVEPCLAVVLVGDDPASGVYVKNKVRACDELGIRSIHKSMPDTTTTDELLAVVDELNADDAVHGILVQLPLPKGVDSSAVLARIDPDKDVDGFHAVNVGRLSQGESGLFPCTPMGVMALLEDSGIELKGKHAVVVGRSNIVGKPMAQLLLHAHCTVSIIHSRTQNPEALCQQADIVVAAVGRPGMVGASWLKEGAYVVDVGINEIADPDLAEKVIKDGTKKMAAFKKRGRVLYGDVSYHDALEVAELVTPVPGGVGPLTIAHLMTNCLTACERNLQK